MTINVLGTEYTITFKNDEDVCADMGESLGYCGGYCGWASKIIVIANLDRCECDSEEEKEQTRKLNLRHEIVHAFLNESGLSFNSKSSDCWAKNEEMVDWFALQGPKICKAWQEAGAL